MIKTVLTYISIRITRTLIIIAVVRNKGTRTHADDQFIITLKKNGYTTFIN